LAAQLPDDANLNTDDSRGARAWSDGFRGVAINGQNAIATGGNCNLTRMSAALAEN
jgi:hypothetical protein